MTIGIDLVGTNLGSGTKTYNINLCNELSLLKLSSNIKIFICKSYLDQTIKKENKKISIGWGRGGGALKVLTLPPIGASPKQLYIDNHPQ